MPDTVEQTADLEPSDSGPSDSGSNRDKNLLEWTVTALGVAIVLSALGYFSYAWATMGDAQAELVIELAAPQQVGDIIEVPVTVRNEGSRVAEAAVVEVCGEPDSCAQLTFDYVPFKSKVEGRVGLDAPLNATLSSRMVSYRKP